MPNNRRLGLGWHRDLPDHRDFTLRHDIIVSCTRQLAAGDGEHLDHVDWREFCPPVEDQCALATSSVHACLGMVQYFERRAHGRLFEPSRLFVYKNARRLLDSVGDSGVSSRTTLKAIRRFGLPPERFWPYQAENLDQEPAAFTYGFHQEYTALTYFRLDPRGVSGEIVLEAAEALLAAGFCFVIGFPVPSAIDASPLVPYPTLADDLRGGQAVLAVGYDSRMRIRSDKGALLIRCSWGTEWGDGGYGWLPYAYVRDGLAADLWTLTRPDWLASGEFRRPDLG